MGYKQEDSELLISESQLELFFIAEACWEGLNNWEANTGKTINRKVTGYMSLKD